MERFIVDRNGANLLSAIYRGVVFLFFVFFLLAVFSFADRKGKKVLLYVCFFFLVVGNVALIYFDLFSEDTVS